MTWWGWILQIVGLTVLAFAAVSSIVRTIRKKPMNSPSLLTSAIAALVAATLFTALSPARPPAYLIVIPIVVGLAAGIAISIPAKLGVRGKEITSSHGFLHLAIWSMSLMASSILVVMSPGAAKAAAVIMLFSCLALAGYSGMLYARYRTGVSRGIKEAGVGLAT